MQKTLLFFLLLFVTYSCTSDNEPAENSSSFNRREMLTHWADNIIIPGYSQLYTINTELNDAVESFIQNPSITTLQQARLAHETAYITWQKVAFLEVGPAKDENLRLYFNTYPVNTEMTDNLALQSDYNFALISNGSRQGYPALDYLLNGFATNDSEIINKYTINENANHYKLYLKALTQRLVDKTLIVKESWEGSYRLNFIENDGSSASASVDKIANNFMFHYEKILRNAKIQFPVGYNSGSPEPQNVESFYKPELSKVLFITANTAMRDFFEGKSYTTSSYGSSFKSYLIEADREVLSNEIISAFNTVNSTADAINGTFKEAVVNDRPAMLNLNDKIQENVLLLKVEMMQTLNIAIAYFDGDGD